MKKLFFILLISSAVLTSCSQPAKGVHSVSPQEGYDAVYNKKESSLQLVDVRTAEEYGVSHLKDAQNICVTDDDFQEKVKTLDKDKPVYVYCKKGGRSSRAAEILSEMGFTQIYDLSGGITAWEEEGLQTTQ
ncbi:rhodanese-like domain-containing protein [Marinirhabdus gelatinilytica]|uniref:Rhodanese-related sulfurtransferase n=1 Tax=Marinirhabdus gelatinilytica TaxID=1703343 RepID=A0A370Q4G1_9FLAO|nr:rhodanese-like domain-containing protein [Marinirhabdus gelatinilytica]RDK83266.1 rhodanese-related sulfurtransferase [Marinirhabdus gelatinilytica]